MKLASFSYKTSAKYVKTGRDRDSGFATTESDSDSKYVVVDTMEMQATPEPADEHASFLNTDTTPIISTSEPVFLADQAIEQVKSLASGGKWKKVMKHKSGVTIDVLQHQIKNTSKTATFKGEAIIEGFSPQSVFYVVGMRKLWDDQFDEGKLVENLNETTSLTYEAYRSSPASSRGHDVVLVEKIDCSSNGTIYFACTSVDTPKVPKMPGKSRHQVKLQGWILEPLHQNPPSTKVTFLTEESVKGWIPGLSRKSLAKRPLIIASINDYLQKKAKHLLAQQEHESSISARSPIASPVCHAFTTDLPSPSSSNTRTVHLPIIKYTPATPVKPDLSHPRSSSLGHVQPQPVHLASPPLSPPSSPDQPIYPADESSPQNIQDVDYPVPLLEPETPSLKLPSPPTSARKLYPTSRHRTARQECIHALKQLVASDLEDWQFVSETNRVHLYSKTVHDSVFKMLRCEGVVEGAWTAEQVCAVIQTFGSRKKWDEHFETGQTVERFSQKEYLVYMQMHSVFPIHSRDFSLVTTIESDAMGTIYVASTSVADVLLPESNKHIRGRYPIYGWALQPLNDRSGVKVTLISHMDLGGVTPLPPAIVRMFTNAAPSYVSRVRDYLEHHGCPPYIRRVAGKIDHEDFDADSGRYCVRYTVKHKPSTTPSAKHSNYTPWCTVIQTHPSVYPNGFEICTTPKADIRVELCKNMTGVRIYSESSELDRQSVELCIIPHTLPGPAHYTWNDIPLCSSAALAISNSVSSDLQETSMVLSSHVLHVVPEENEMLTLVLSDELSFTGPQLYIIFIVMVACYYLGKISC